MTENKSERFPIVYYAVIILAVYVLGYIALRASHCFVHTENVINMQLYGTSHWVGASQSGNFLLDVMEGLYFPLIKIEQAVWGIVR